MAAEATPFSAPRLGLAVLLGLVLEALFLALGLRANLAMASLCGSSPTCYWILNGLYLVLGFGLGLLLVPWAALRVRAAIFGGVLLIGLLIGVRAIAGW